MQPMGGNSQGLPPLPNVAPAGSYPSYEQILKNAGVPIMDNYTPNNVSQANEYNNPAVALAQQKLAYRVGMGGYEEPNIPASTPLATQRLQQIRDFLGKYSPEDYASVLKGDDRIKQRNRGFDALFGTDNLFSQNRTDMDRQADVLI